MSLHLRVAAAQATLDAYLEQPFAWGTADCVRMAAHVLRGLGYAPPLRRGGAYKTEFGARKALKRAGYDDVADALDALGLPRLVSVSHALPADIVGYRHPSQPGWTTLMVCVGQGRVLGFMEDAGGVCHAFTPRLDAPETEYLAWRCDPCRKS